MPMQSLNLSCPKNIVWGLKMAPEVQDTKKTAKIVTCAIIKETEKLKETMVRAQVE